MTFVTRHTIAVRPATASGSTALSSAALNGLVYAVGFSPSTGNPWATTIDLAVRVENGPDIIHVDLNASLGEQMFWPRRSANGTASGVVLPAGNASSVEPVMVPLGNQRVQVIATSGGATTSGTVNLYLV